MGVADDGGGVVLGETAALRVAADVQARHDSPVLVEGVAVGVGADAVGHAEGEDVGDLGGVERRLEEGVQTVGALAEVLVAAQAGELVVAGDGLLQLVGRHLDGLSQLLEGVALGSGGLLDLSGGALADLLDVVAPRLALDILVDVPVAGMAVGHGVNLLGVLGVEDLVGLLLGLTDGDLGEQVAGDVLVAEALAVLVHQQERVAAQGAAEGVGHDGSGGELRSGAGPGGHLQAHTHVGGVALVVGGGPAEHHLEGLVAVVGAHLGVRAVVTAGVHDSLGVDLGDLAVGVLGPSAAHSALVVGDELQAPRGEVHVRAGLDDLQNLVVQRHLVGTEADDVGIHGVQLGAVVVLGVLGVVEAGHVHVAIGGAGAHAARGDVLAVHTRLSGGLVRVEEDDVGVGRHVPVEGLAGVVDPVVPDARVGTPAVGLHLGVQHADLLLGREDDAALLGPAGVDVAELSGAAVVVLGLLDADDVGALLDGGTSGAQAGDAQAHDEHVAVELLVSGLGSGGRNEPAGDPHAVLVPVAGVSGVVDGEVGVARGALGGGGVTSSVALGHATGSHSGVRKAGGTGDGGNGSRAYTQERTARNLRAHNVLLCRDNFRRARSPCVSAPHRRAGFDSMHTAALADSPQCCEDFFRAKRLTRFLRCAGFTSPRWNYFSHYA